MIKRLRLAKQQLSGLLGEGLSLARSVRDYSNLLEQLSNGLSQPIAKRDEKTVLLKAQSIYRDLEAAYEMQYKERAVRAAAWMLDNGSNLSGSSCIDLFVFAR